MALELTPLITAADEELAQVEKAKQDLATKSEELSAAQRALSEAQEAVDGAGTTLATEKTEAVAALRAIVAAVNTKIDEISAPSGS